MASVWETPYLQGGVLVWFFFCVCVYEHTQGLTLALHRCKQIHQAHRDGVLPQAHQDPAGYRCPAANLREGEPLRTRLCLLSGCKQMSAAALAQAKAPAPKTNFHINSRTRHMRSLMSIPCVHTGAHAHTRATSAPHYARGA